MIPGKFCGNFDALQSSGKLSLRHLGQQLLGNVLFSFQGRSLSVGRFEGHSSAVEDSLNEGIVSVCLCCCLFPALCPPCGFTDSDVTEDSWFPVRPPWGYGGQTITQPHCTSISVLQKTKYNEISPLQALLEDCQISDSLFCMHT